MLLHTDRRPLVKAVGTIFYDCNVAFSIKLQQIDLR
jgi:hypothetical protein